MFIIETFIKGVFFNRRMAYYYVKTDRTEWKYPQDSGNLTDWDNFPTGKMQDFATFSRNQLYWKALKKGDIIIGHSTYITFTKKNKETQKPEVRKVPKARISAIAIVAEEEHYSNDKHFECDVVTLRKLVGFHPILLDQKLKEKFKDFEPFKPGRYRWTISRLKPEEYALIIKAILEEYPEIENELAKNKLLP